MAFFNSYKSTLIATAIAISLGACQNDFDDLKVEAPVSDLPVTMSIADLKTKYWDDATNYCVQILPTETDPRPTISGRVISSDAAGNIYKKIVIQDATGAIGLSVNANSLYTRYRIGQEIRLDLTGMYIGKYNGLQLIGVPAYYQGSLEVERMTFEMFRSHLSLNGNPEPVKVDTLVCEYSDLSTAPADLIKWQNQLIRLNNCKFELGGQVNFADPDVDNSATNRTVVLEDGNTITVRNSVYANFKADLLPQGQFDLVGILSYFGSQGWQIELNDRQGIMNLGNATVSPGAETNPWNVDQTIAEIEKGKTPNGWVSGYIVGAVAPGVTSVTSNADIEFTSTPTLDNTLVIAADPACTDFAKCLVFSLPQDSKLRQYGNLVDNPGNYQAQMMLKGTMSKYLDTYGVIGNRGTAAEFHIDGVTVPEDPIVTPTLGDGTEANPYTASQVLTLGNPGTEAWVTGYIVGFAPAAVIADAVFVLPCTNAANVLIADDPACTDYKQCVPVQLLNGSEIRSKVNLLDNPGNLGKKLTLCGTLAAYFNTPGVKGASTQFTLEGEGQGGDTPVTPPTPGTALDVTSADLATMNNGTATSYYGTYTSADGWAATNCNVLQGGETDANPVFAFLGSASTFAVTLNGKTTAVGSLTSPLIASGIKTLTFNYAFPYSDTKCKLTVRVKQNDAVVAEDTLENNSMTKLQVYTYTHDFNVSGDFVLEIVNDCPSAKSDANKDRVAVWDINWTR